jgi:hypothetical protein
MLPKRASGQYFTPESVVDLCYRLLRVVDPDTPAPRIIDPACGEGIFLAHALQRGLTLSDHLFGIDRDPVMASAWYKSGLSGKLYVADGLLPQRDVEDGTFDWVVGNPPFGTGVFDARSVGARFSIWRSRGSDIGKCPAEIIFLERFLQLAKPGGYAAIVLPDGIFANARLAYVRDWLFRHTEIKAIVSLPQSTFIGVGACAKADILVIRKVMEASETGVAIMAALRSRAPISKGIDGLAKAFDKLNRSCCPTIVSSPPWEVFTADRLAPGDRLDPAYHHPEYVEIIETLSGLPHIVALGDLIKFTTYGQVGPREYVSSGVRLLTPANLVVTPEGFTSGIDLRFPERFVQEGSRNDPARSRLHMGDLLLANSGVGCIGRPAVYYGGELCNISQHVNLVRLADIEPEYVAVYLQTCFGRMQINREKCGVGAHGINFGRIKSILVPVVAGRLRRKIAAEYRDICRYPHRTGAEIRRLVSELEALVIEPDSYDT